MGKSLPSFLLTLAIAALAAAVFLLDLWLPLGVAVGVLYAGVVFLALWSPRRHDALLVAAGCSVLIAWAFFRSPPGYDRWIDLTSRGLEIFAVWTTALLVLLRKQTEAALHRAQATLERRVEERTAELARAVEAAQAELIERKRAEAERRTTEERLQLIARATNDAVWEWDFATDAVWWGEGLHALFGYEPAQGATTIGWWSERIHPDDRDRIVTDVRAALDRDERAWSGDYRFRRADGSFAHVLDRGYIVYDERGRSVRMIGSILDMTERKRAEQLLHESQEQYRRLFESNPLPTWVYDVDTLAFLAVNDAAVRHYGYSREEFLAMTIKDIRPSADVPRLLDYLSTIRDAAEGTNIGAWRHRRKDGTIIDVELAFHTLPYQGRPARLVLVNDVTERRQMEQMRAQLLEQVITAQEEERRRIARELHDEIGQSLTALLVGLRAMENGRREGAGSAGGSELWKIAAQTLQEVQRLALGLRPSVLDDLGLEAALNRYTDEFAKIHGIETEVQVVGMDGRRLRHAVETALYRIVQEALTNIAKHARATSVSLLVVRGPSAVQAIVEDDGRGFEVERVLKAGATRHLGLHGIRERVALLHGTLSIESSPGGGTVVSVQIPLEAEAR
ncbi:PAS domain-containing sensor histidine kinase [Candidatus Nitrospira bockiana]